MGVFLYVSPSIIPNAQLLSADGTTIAQATTTPEGLLIGKTTGGFTGVLIGPLIGQETTYAAMWTGANALAPAAGNYHIALQGAGGGTDFFNNAISLGGVWNFNLAAPFMSLFAGGSGAFFAQSQSTTGAGNALTTAAQAAKTGSAADGGSLSYAGGAGDGAGVDGRIAVTTPFDGGELEFTPVAGANNLTNAQSDANIINLLAGVAAAFTVTFKRRIANTSWIFVRNNTTQTATIAYLSGGTVAVATLTSALIASNGANLVKILVGT